MSLTEAGLRACLADDVLHLILMPTEACNFRCVYCYEDFKYRRMEPWVVRGVKALLNRRVPELDVLALSWFGGEPLLARDIMEEILLHVRALCRDRPGIQFTSGATTNAYLLTRPVFERLLELGNSEYQISFDGPREWHDRKRIQANGRGTFDRIWGNLLALRDVPRNFSIVVRLHVDGENRAAIPRFIEEYERDFGRDARFKLFMRGLSRLGGPNDATLPVLGDGALRRVLKTLSQCAEEHKIEQLAKKPEASICYAARANSFLVRANGRVNKCTVALEHPANQVGRIHEDGRLELEPYSMQHWMRGVWSRRASELECPMHGLADPVATAPVLAAAAVVPRGRVPRRKLTQRRTRRNASSSR